MINACFVTHLYCRYSEAGGVERLVPGDCDLRHWQQPAEFTGRTWNETKRQARRAGWRFGRDGDVTCPTCVKHGAGWDKPSRSERQFRPGEILATDWELVPSNARHGGKP